MSQVAGNCLKAHRRTDMVPNAQSRGKYTDLYAAFPEPPKWLGFCAREMRNGSFRLLCYFSPDPDQLYLAGLDGGTVKKDGAHVDGVWACSYLHIGTLS